MMVNALAMIGNAVLDTTPYLCDSESPAMAVANLWFKWQFIYHHCNSFEPEIHLDGNGNAHSHQLSAPSTSTGT